MLDNARIAPREAIDKSFGNKDRTCGLADIIGSTMTA